MTTSIRSPTKKKRKRKKRKIHLAAALPFLCNEGLGDFSNFLCIVCGKTSF